MSKIYWNNIEDELIQAIKNPVVQGVIKKINDKTPDSDGLITLTASDFGALTQADLTSALSNVLEQTDIVDDLDTGGIDKALSAEQGKNLKGLIDALIPFTQEERDKLANIAESANNYSLPIATDTVLGGVKQGTGVIINEDGTISVTGNTSKFSIIDAVLPTVLTSDSAYPEGFSMFSVNSSATYILEWAESVGALDELLDPEFNRAVVETYKNSEAPDTSYQLMRTFQGNIIGNVYSRLLHPNANGDWTDIFSTKEKAKLEGIEEGANKYVLPVATTDILGGVKVDGTTITANSEGAITSVTGGLDIPPALPTVGFAHYPNGVSSFFVTSSLEESREKFDAWLTLIGESPASHTTNKAIHVHTEKTPTIGLQRETLIQTIRLYDTRTGSDKLISDNFRIGASSRWGVIHKRNIEEYVLPIATDINLGGIKQGTGITIEADGTANINFPTTTQPQFGAFTATTAVNVTHGFIYTPDVVIKPEDTVDNFIINYNTTTLSKSDFTIEEIEGVRVIVLNVDEADTAEHNSVSGFILRGFAPLS